MSPTWTNWPGDQICAPSVIARPTSEAELVDLVAQAAQRGQRVRAVGSGHSFTDIACTDGVMIDMTGLQRVIKTESPATGLVTIEGGAKLRTLGPQLARLGLGLENQGDVDPQSITGATATATHGTGARFQNVSACIVSLRLVTASGDVVSLSSDDDYLAARVSLGALGVISQVTLKAVPLYTLHRTDRKRSLAETLERLDEFVNGNDHFEFFIFPHASTALTRTMRRSDEEPKSTAGRKRMISENIENGGLNLICQAGRRVPATAPRLNRLMTNLMSSSTVVDRAYKGLCHPTQGEVHRDGVRHPANPRARGASARHRRGSTSQPSCHVSYRSAVLRCRRRLLIYCPRTRHLLHRRSPVQRHGVRNLLPCGRGDHDRVCGPAALG